MTLAAEPIEWVKALVPLGAALVQLGGAAAVAYFGFRYGLRKTREERGFDRRMAWYEETLTASRALREAVQQGAAAESLCAGRRRATENAATAPGDGISVAAADEFAVTAWGIARERAGTFLRVLERAVTHADVESEAAAATALITVRSLSAHFTHDARLHPGDGSPAVHPYHLLPDYTPAGLLPGFLFELQRVERAAIAGARSTLGYPPRLPELVPNAQGVIEIPSRDTNRTPSVRKLLQRIGLAR